MGRLVLHGVADARFGAQGFGNHRGGRAARREIDNKAVRESQVARLKKIRETRDGKKVAAALEVLTQAAQSVQGNLLALGIEAARVRATVGEISAMEKVWGRYHAEIRSITGIYGGAFGDDAEWKTLRSEVDKFAADHGRRPHMLVAKISQDGHDRGAKVIATAFADLGFDVDVGTLFQTPEEVARQAVENDMHVIGIATQSGGHKTLVPQLIAELKTQGSSPPKDYKMLEAAGVKAIFGPGTQIPAAAQRVLGLLSGSVAVESPVASPVDSPH